MHQKYNMRSAKAFADAVAILLAVLVVVYLVCAYMKLDTTKYEATDESFSKLEYFLDKQPNTAYFHLLLTLAASIAAGFILTRARALCILFSALPLIYTLVLNLLDVLTLYPNATAVLCAAHFGGTVAYAAMEDRRDGRMSATLGGSLLSLSCLGAIGYVIRDLALIAPSHNMIEEMREGGLVLTPRLRIMPEVVETVYREFITAGSTEAQYMAHSIAREIELSIFETQYYLGLDSTELGAYIRAGVLLLASTVLCIVLARKLPTVSLIASAIPTAYILINIQMSNMSGIALCIMTLTVAAFCANAAAFAASGKRAPDGSGDDGDDDDDDEIIYNPSYPDPVLPSAAPETDTDKGSASDVADAEEAEETAEATDTDESSNEDEEISYK